MSVLGLACFGFDEGSGLLHASTDARCRHLVALEPVDACSLSSLFTSIGWCVQPPYHPGLCCLRCGYYQEPQRLARASDDLFLQKDARRLPWRASHCQKQIPIFWSSQIPGDKWLAWVDRRTFAAPCQCCQTGGTLGAQPLSTGGTGQRSWPCPLDYVS